MAERVEVTVIGCGVVGLTTAIALQERGVAVRIVARELPPDTTSDVPPAFFHPFKVEPAARVLPWARTSFARLLCLARDPASGVCLRSAVESYPEPVPEPWWKEVVGSFRRAAPAELPAWARHGFVYASPVMETPIYLPWLVRGFLAAGGAIEQREAGDLAAEAQGRVVVNCSGLGARELARDPQVFPSRGQLVRLEPVALERVVLDLGAPGIVTYVVPRRDAVVLGGTVEDGVESVAVDPAASAAIVERARRLVPALCGARVLAAVAGVRPCRSEVRLEAEALAGGGAVVHNYGHGGAGFSISWGCAAEAARLAVALAAARLQARKSAAGARR